MSDDLAILIEELREYEGGRIGWYARGHHDPATFLDAAIELELIDAGDVARVRHEYWRNTPAPGGNGTLFHRARGPGRGAYPVTVIE